MQPTIDQRLALRERPNRTPVMYQSWNDLLFLHWELDASEIQSRLPKGLTVDCFEGRAYVGIVPFLMRNIRWRGTPCLPWSSNFLELNVRTYVHDQAGNAGVWFLSLDCNQPLAVWTARTLFHLPYLHAKMDVAFDPDGSMIYNSTRNASRGDERRNRFEYNLDGQVEFAEPGTLEFFLAERYLLFAANKKGSLFSGRVYHTPYPLNAARVSVCDTTMFELNGFESPRTPFVHAIGSRGVDVCVYALEKTP